MIIYSIYLLVFFLYCFFLWKLWFQKRYLKEVIYFNNNYKPQWKVVYQKQLTNSKNNWDLKKIIKSVSLPSNLSFSATQHSAIRIQTRGRMCSSVELWWKHWNAVPTSLPHNNICKPMLYNTSERLIPVLTLLTSVSIKVKALEKYKEDTEYLCDWKLIHPILFM